MLSLSCRGRAAFVQAFESNFVGSGSEGGNAAHVFSCRFLKVTGGSSNCPQRRSHQGGVVAVEAGSEQHGDGEHGSHEGAAAGGGAGGGDDGRHVQPVKKKKTCTS